MRHLLLTLLVLCSPSLSAQTQTVRYNVVELSAEVQREVANDWLTVVLAVEESSPDAARLASSVNRILGEAIKAAREHPSVKASSGNLRTFPVYGQRANQLQGWRARGEIRLETRDFAAASVLIGKLQGSLQLQSFVFSLSPESRRTVENELIIEAAAAFRSRVEVAQKALGARGYKLQRVQFGGDHSVSPEPRFMASRALKADASVPPPVEAGSSVVTMTASGAVELE